MAQAAWVIILPLESVVPWLPRWWVGALGTSVHRELVHNPVIANELKKEVNVDNVPFISNDQLRSTLAGKSATPEQLSEAVRINIEARMVALKVSFFTLAGLALLAFFPAGGLPRLCAWRGAKR